MLIEYLRQSKVQSRGTLIKMGRFVTCVLNVEF